MSDHNVAAWIIICSGRAQNAIESLGVIAAKHPDDADTHEVLGFLKTTDEGASLLANQMAEIDNDEQPKDGSLSRGEKLVFWMGRAKQAVGGMCETALYLVQNPGAVEPPLVRIVELLEAIEEDATRLTMAVATRH